MLNKVCSIELEDGAFLTAASSSQQGLRKSDSQQSLPGTHYSPFSLHVKALTPPGPGMGTCPRLSQAVCSDVLPTGGRDRHLAKQRPVRTTLCNCPLWWGGGEATECHTQVCWRLLPALGGGRSWSIVGEKQKHDSMIPGGLSSRFLLSWKPEGSHALPQMSRCLLP